MIKKDQIIESILEGAASSCRQYIIWTGECTVHDYGVEAKISNGIADHLFKTGNGYVSLEEPFESLRKESLKKTRRGPPRREFEGRPRADVVLFDSSGRAKAVIEAKRSIGFANSRTDIGRLNAILHDLGGRSGTVKLGCVVGIRPRLVVQKSIGGFIAEFCEKVEMKFPALTCRGKSKGFKIPARFAESFRNDYGITGYDAVCFYLRLRNGRR